MSDILTEKERNILNFYKKEYDKIKSASIASVQPKLEVKISEDIPASLQAKGYLEIKRDNFGYNSELVSVFLTDKFFEYFDT